MGKHLYESTKLQSHATPDHMGFAVNTVAPEQASLQVLEILPVTVVLQMLHTNISFLYH